MKKSIIIATISAAIAMSTIGYAYDLDLKSLSDEEIAQLFTDVTQEVVDRNINKSSDLLPGTYVGGVDIPVGGYDISAPANDEYFQLDLVGVDKNTPNYRTYQSANPGVEANFHINIQDGYSLTVEGRTATITVNNGLNFK